MADETSPDQTTPLAVTRTGRTRLVPIAISGQALEREARAGGLRLDIDAAKSLLARITDVKLRVGTLIGDCAGLDVPLQLGKSFVGRIMSERLYAMAADEYGGVAPMLKLFEQVAITLETTVDLAVRNYIALDEAAEAVLNDAGGQVDPPQGGVAR